MMAVIRQCQANKMCSSILVDFSARTQLDKLNPPLGSYYTEHKDSQAKPASSDYSVKNGIYSHRMTCLRHVRQMLCSTHPLRILNIRKT